MRIEGRIIVRGISNFRLSRLPWPLKNLSTKGDVDAAFLILAYDSTRDAQFLKCGKLPLSSSHLPVFGQNCQDGLTHKSLNLHRVLMNL